MMVRKHLHIAADINLKYQFILPDLALSSLKFVSLKQAKKQPRRQHLDG